MKYGFAALFVCAACFSAFSAEPADDAAKLMKQLKSNTRIGTVSDNIVRNDADVKVLTLKFYSYQDKRDKESTYQMRITVEVEDKEGNLYSGQTVRRQGIVPSDYTGEDDWEFQAPLPGLEKPKLTAYAVEYGILQEKTFIPLIAELKRAESAEEILGRSKKQLRVNCTHHSFWYGGN